MINLYFEQGGETIIVGIAGDNLTFGRLGAGIMAPIEGLKLSYDGCIKEFPDLADKINWREEAIVRFKKHIRTLIDENSRAIYVIEDLKLHGYTPLAMQRAGFRAVRL